MKDVDYVDQFQPIIDELRQKIPLKAVVLVGSRGRGDCIDHSDYDLLVIADMARRGDRTEFERLIRSMALRLREISVDPFCISPGGLETTLKIMSKLVPSQSNDRCMREFTAATSFSTGIVLYGEQFVRPIRAHYDALVASGELNPPEALSFLPDARDGFTTTQRRMLFSMFRLGLAENDRFRKSAIVVYECLEHFQPHGRTFLYATIVTLAQPWVTRYPIVEGQGNFGSINPDPPAAMRYTEARLSKIAHEVLDDIAFATTEFGPAYSESCKEPKFLPVRLPFSLINGAQDIRHDDCAIMPPYNLTEICDAIVAMIGNPGLSDESLFEIIKGPDFPTGGSIVGESGIRDWKGNTARTFSMANR